jgi:hypothetical protein
MHGANSFVTVVSVLTSSTEPYGSVYSSSPICTPWLTHIPRRVTWCPYLWRKVEAQITAARQAVLDQQGHFVGEADLDRVGQGRGLAEVDKVLEGEGERDGLAELDLDRLARLLDARVLPQGDGAVADVALARELDAVLARVDGDCAASVSKCAPQKKQFRLAYPTQTWLSDLS